MRLAAGALAALAAVPVAAAHQQADRESDQEARIERYLEAARAGRAQIRPQAARALVGIGAPAAERLVALSGETNAALAELGKDLVEVLGEFGDERLRARLWRAVDDPDFPWRPQAARSLAAAPSADEAARIAALTDDPLAAVRAGAVDGLSALDHRASVDRVRALLADPDDRVRRAAAALLDEWGDHGALSWLVEDLVREDAYFGQKHGRQARYDSFRILAERLGGDFGYDPELAASDPELAAAVGRIAARVRERAGGDEPELPAVARAGPVIEDDAIGLELRSCRRGEHFLRWSLDDVLYVGLGNPVRVELPEGTVAGLVAAGAPAFEALGKQRMWGEPGCDLEQFHWRPEGTGRARTLRVSKGPEAVEGLRPPELSAFAARLLATVPQDGDDPRLADLRARVRSTLEVLGGKLGEGE